MVAFCVLWALPGQPSEERPRGPSLVRSAGSSRAGVVLLRMVTAILHCGLRDRGECLLQRGAIGVGCPLDVLVGDVHPGFAHVVMSAHAAAVQTHVRLLSFDGVGDRPRPGANWLGARRRSFRDFALVCGERGENLALLPRRHLEGVEATPEFGRDLVELIRGDVQFAMGLLQPQVGAPGLRRREGERPARGLAQPQGPHELEPGQAVQLPGAPFIQRVVGRPLADLPVLHDGVAEVVHHGCDGEHTTEPLVQALLSHLYVLLPISSWLARHAPVYHTVRSPSPRGSDLASASTNPESTEARRLTAWRGPQGGEWPRVGLQRPCSGVNDGRATAEMALRCVADWRRPISSHADATPGAAAGWRGRQASSGIARRRARAAANSAAQGQRAGRWSVSRRALRVSRPARANSRRRRVLVVTIPAPRPIRAVQRARLCAMTWTASQAAFAANLPDGR